MEFVHLLAIKVRFFADLATDIMKDRKRIVGQCVDRAGWFAQKPQPNCGIKLFFDGSLPCENDVFAHDRLAGCLARAMLTLQRLSHTPLYALLFLLASAVTTNCCLLLHSNYRSHYGHP